MPTPLDKCEQMIVELREKIKSFSEKSTLLDKLPKEIESLSEKFALIAQTSTKDEINALEKKLDSILNVLQEPLKVKAIAIFKLKNTTMLFLNMKKQLNWVKPLSKLS